ncbi:MAG TPA: hypothetical protein VMC03_12765 [Streptosporangiaceae bacterium]|nr:hypothetical protein [Streptosporangiaceae bacterium]
MRRTTAALAATAFAMLLAACSSGSPAATSTSTPSSSAAAATPSAAATAASGPTASQSAASTSLDPCQLVTSSEASSLAGASFGPGREEAENGGKQCVYGYQTTNVFTVELGQASDPATAQADWSQEQSQAEALVEQKLPSGVNISLNTQNVTGLGDRAATANGSTTIEGKLIGMSAIYLLKGATFLSFSDIVLGEQGPSASAMQTEAATALARVPS